MFLSHLMCRAKQDNDGIREGQEDAWVCATVRDS